MIEHAERVGNWVIANGVAGVLFAVCCLIFYLYLTERWARVRAEARVEAVLRERISAEKANSAALIRTHSEVGKSLQVMSDLADNFMDHINRKG